MNSADETKIIQECYRNEIRRRLPEVVNDMDKKQTGSRGWVRKTKPFPESPNIGSGTVAGDGKTAGKAGLRPSEIERLDAIAMENGVTRDRLVAYALRRFMSRYDAGKVRIVKKAMPASKP